MTAIQHYNGGHSQCSKARKRNKTHRDLKGRNGTLFVNNINTYVERFKESPEKKVIKTSKVI